MSVDAGQEAEYERRHRPIPPELEAVLKAHGAHRYTIWLHPETRQPFGTVEVEDEARWNAIAQTPECRKWWSFRADIMLTGEGNAPVSQELREVFHLD